MRRAVSRAASLPRKARRDAAIISMRATSAFTRRINARFVARRADLHASLSAEKTPCLNARRLPFGAPRPLRLAGSTGETARSTSCGTAGPSRNDLFPSGQRGTPCPPGFWRPSRCRRLFCNVPNLLILVFAAYIPLRQVRLRAIFGGNLDAAPIRVRGRFGSAGGCCEGFR